MRDPLRGTVSIPSYTAFGTGPSGDRVHSVWGFLLMLGQLYAPFKHTSIPYGEGFSSGDIVKRGVSEGLLSWAGCLRHDQLVLDI